ncbi:acyl-CoA dehydrogenase family protein [Kitasatospora viridis]|uniref:Hpt domain-containing protein n=1 Tax=Kitasatospora viridis TaxID=281105 RepID=A0A561TT51_9ACTN|nr:acyl-CoA dehydrogenase family protein [Kitasatospora viridis]TWF90278.1 Hpt domain-containing protein [Kitasatospora viridis]
MSIENELAVAREAGYHGTAGPVAEAALVAGPLVERAGLALPAGVVTFAAGPLEARFARPDAQHRVGPVGARGLDDALRVSGTLHRVPWARGADAVVVLTDGPWGGPALLVLTAGEYRLLPGGNLAGEPRDELVLLDAAVPAERVRRVPAELAREAHWRSGLARAALIAGAARRCVELTVTHTASRVQFGRPLDRFQAVKQEQARLVEETALVTAAVDAVGRAGAEEIETAAWIAAAQAAASVAEIARIAHQLHGAIGFTGLSPLHEATTRMWSWRDEDGGERAWQRLLGRRVVERDGLWETVTGGQHTGRDLGRGCLEACVPPA